jgi:hypothetical protein
MQNMSDLERARENAMISFRKIGSEEEFKDLAQRFIQHFDCGRAYLNSFSDSSVLKEGIAKLFDEKMSKTQAFTEVHSSVEQIKEKILTHSYELLSSYLELFLAEQVHEHIQKNL